MRFSSFLTENKNLKNEATLVLHKIISMVDNGHVEVTDSAMRFSVGAMIHKGAYNKLYVVVRKGESGVQLGRSRTAEGVSAIVVGVDKLPDRKGIDTLLSKTETFNKFVEAFVTYLTRVHDHQGEHDKHDDEMEVENTGNFEDNYKALIAEFESTNIDSYKKAVAEVTGSTEGNANSIHQEVSKMSLGNLKKEYIGTSEAEFLALVKKLPSYDKFTKIDKAMAAKADARLKTYYTGHIKQLAA